MPLDEDTTRYTAPPDNDAEEPTYSTAYILAYIESWIPATDRYTLEEVKSLIGMALSEIDDEDTGIDTV
jgi:hypothetical protein